MADRAVAQLQRVPSLPEPTTDTAPNLPALPVEILSHIIRLSLPQTPAPSNDFAKRSAALRSYALVSPTWRHLAQRELFARPTIRTSADVASFLDTLRARPALIAVVRGVALGRCDNCEGVRRSFNAEADAAGDAEVLATCVKLEEVHLYGLTEVKLSCVGVLQALHTLVLHRVTFEFEVPKEARFALPRLEHLVFRDVDARLNGLLAIRPTFVLPALRVLAIHSSPFVELGLSGLSHHTLEAVSLDVSETGLPDCFEQPPGVPVLWDWRTTYIPTYAERDRRPFGDVAISHLKCTFTNSDLLWRSRNCESLLRLAAMMRSGTFRALRRLRSIYLQADFEGEDKIAELLEVCRERRIVVFYRDWTHPHGLVDSEVLEEFARARREARITLEAKQKQQQQQQQQQQQV